MVKWHNINIVLHIYSDGILLGTATFIVVHIQLNSYVKLIQFIAISIFEMKYSKHLITFNKCEHAQYSNMFVMTI